MADETGAFDPNEHTVDEVNAYLDEHPEDDEAVLAAEAKGQGRKGILEGPHASPSDTEDGETPKGTDLKAETFSEAAKHVPVAEGEKYEQGYSGFSPARDAGEDLTLQAVLKDA